MSSSRRQEAGRQEVSCPGHARTYVHNTLWPVWLYRRPFAVDTVGSEVIDQRALTSPRQCFSRTRTNWRQAVPDDLLTAHGQPTTAHTAHTACALGSRELGGRYPSSPPAHLPYRPCSRLARLGPGQLWRHSLLEYFIHQSTIKVIHPTSQPAHQG